MEQQQVKTLKDPVKKRSVVVGTHKTAVSLEDGFWFALARIAKQRGIYKSRLMEIIDNERGAIGLSSACRQFVLREVQNDASFMFADRG